jgi:hypothetical protein
VKVSFDCNYEEGVISEESIMCKWEMKTLNGVQVGCMQEILVGGMLKALFSPTNKLIYLELTFDVMGFMQQLRRASGRSEFCIVPNTYQLATEQASDPHIITECTSPFRILYASKVSALIM